MPDLSEKRRQQLKASKQGKSAPAKQIIAPAPSKKLELMPEATETCIACGQKLKWVPINSRVRALVCANARCNQYRNRLRIESSKPIK